MAVAHDVAVCPWAGCVREWHSLADVSSHICADHLFYFPFRCVTCRWTFPSEAQLKKHIVKSRHLDQIAVSYDDEQDAKLETVLRLLADHKPEIIEEEPFVASESDFGNGAAPNYSATEDVTQPDEGYLAADETADETDVPRQSSLGQHELPLSSTDDYDADAVSELLQEILQAPLLDDSATILAETNNGFGDNQRSEVPNCGLSPRYARSEGDVRETRSAPPESAGASFLLPEEVNVSKQTHSELDVPSDFEQSTQAEHESDRAEFVPVSFDAERVQTEDVEESAVVADEDRNNAMQTTDFLDTAQPIVPVDEETQSVGSVSAEIPLSLAGSYSIGQTSKRKQKRRRSLKIRLKAPSKGAKEAHFGGDFSLAPSKRRNTKQSRSVGARSKRRSKSAKSSTKPAESESVDTTGYMAVWNADDQSAETDLQNEDAPPVETPPTLPTSATQYSNKDDSTAVYYTTTGCDESQPRTDCDIVEIELQELGGRAIEIEKVASPKRKRGRPPKRRNSEGPPEVKLNALEKRARRSIDSALNSVDDQASLERAWTTLLTVVRREWRADATAVCDAGASLRSNDLYERMERHFAALCAAEALRVPADGAWLRQRVIRIVINLRQCAKRRRKSVSRRVDECEWGESARQTVLPLFAEDEVETGDSRVRVGAEMGVGGVVGGYYALRMRVVSLHSELGVARCTVVERGCFHENDSYFDPVHQQHVRFDSLKTGRFCSGFFVRYEDLYDIDDLVETKIAALRRKRRTHSWGVKKWLPVTADPITD